MHSDKLSQTLQQLIIKAQRQLHIRELAKKKKPNIMEEDMVFLQFPHLMIDTLSKKSPFKKPPLKKATLRKTTFKTINEIKYTIEF